MLSILNVSGLSLNLNSILNTHGFYDQRFWFLIEFEFYIEHAWFFCSTFLVSY
jgi:hypothetical protein